MSKGAYDKTPEGPDAGRYSKEPRPEGAAGQTPEEEAAPESAEGKGREGEQEEKREEEREKQDSNLQVEHWQAPKPDRMKADTREIWEFESESVPPSRAFWYSLFLIIFTLAGGLALIAYGIWWLVTAAGS
jgi:hypothetical protein